MRINLHIAGYRIRLTEAQDYPCIRRLWSYGQVLWVKKSERSLAHPFPRGCQDTSPFEIVDCRPTTEVVLPPFSHRGELVRVPRPLRSCQAAAS